MLRFAIHLWASTKTCTSDNKVLQDNHIEHSFHFNVRAGNDAKYLLPVEADFHIGSTPYDKENVTTLYCWLSIVAACINYIFKYWIQEPMISSISSSFPVFSAFKFFKCWITLSSFGFPFLLVSNVVFLLDYLFQLLNSCITMEPPTAAGTRIRVLFILELINNFLSTIMLASRQILQ